MLNGVDLENTAIVTVQNGGELTASDINFANNPKKRAAFASQGGTATFTDCDFTNNMDDVDEGGAFFVSNQGFFTFISCLFDDNKGRWVEWS